MSGFIPKVYNQDGTGRDSYIFYNNGGFYSPQGKLQTMVSDSKWFPAKGYSHSQHFKPNNRIFYQSDGTGRDTYVVGNIRNKITFDPEFPNVLRNYNPETTQPKFGYKLPPLAQSKVNLISKMQKSSIGRLSVPKLRTQQQ